MPDSLPGSFSPWLNDIEALVAAGAADIIALMVLIAYALVPVKALLLRACSSFRKIAMAKIVPLLMKGCIVINSVLNLLAQRCRVIPVGKYQNYRSSTGDRISRARMSSDCGRALNTNDGGKGVCKQGAWAVTVGSALTRLEHVW